MTKESKLKVIASHNFPCRGFKKDRITPALPKGEEVYPIINAFENGSTDVLCNYNFRSECTALRRARPEIKTNMPLGFCPYNRS